MVNCTARSVKMGQRWCRTCPLKKEDLDDYQLLTFLTRAEIIACYDRFSEIESRHVTSSRQQQSRRAGNNGGGKETRLPIDAIVSATPGLRAAPLGDRVCAAFSSERDGRMSFEDYLDMVSVMSERANPEIKAHFAFLAFDFDGDGVVGKSDLGKVADRLFHTSEKHLTADERSRVVSRLLDEVDVDKDGFVCKPEFRFAGARCADFYHAFKLHLT